MDTRPGGSGDEVATATRLEIFLMLKDCAGKDLQCKIEYLENQYSERMQKLVNIRSNARKHLAQLFAMFKKYWNDSSRNVEFFQQKHEKWLSITESIPLIVSIPLRANTEKKRTGRPWLEFDGCSESSKRKKTSGLRETTGVSELTYAAQMSLRSSGQFQAAKVMKGIMSSPTRASKYMKAYSKTVETTMSLSEALSVIVEGKLTRRQYNVVRSASKLHNCKAYPTYEAVREEKKRCYPPRSAITVSETCAEVNLQSLLDHTCSRLLLLQAEVIATLPEEKLRNVVLICKWGCDGTSGQSEYKQSFNESTVSDASIFFTSLVPLHLTCCGEIVLWKNPRPSSPRYCRPIKIEFCRETVESTVNLVKNIEDQIAALHPFTTVINGTDITVKYTMLFTMIDGKVCNSVSSTKSTQRCYLCDATSKDFNNIDNVLQLKVKDENLRLGLSTLHAWIRMFECLLHLSYKLSVKKWQVRSTDEKDIVAKRKACTQKGLRSELGIIVDCPKQSYGSSNDGNTARTFFKNSAKVSAITGLDKNIIDRFHVILQALASGHDIDATKFDKYAVETARKFIDLYPWYRMPTTVHKILIHGSKIIAHAPIPIGQLSEEAQESRNKDLKEYRKKYSRKCSREQNLTDVLNWLLVSSDVLISSIRKLPVKKLKKLTYEAIYLLRCSHVPSQQDNSANESASDTDDCSEPD